MGENKTTIVANFCIKILQSYGVIRICLLKWQKIKKVSSRKIFKVFCEKHIHRFQPFLPMPMDKLVKMMANGIKQSLAH